jgi:hypothetical protein
MARTLRFIVSLLIGSSTGLAQADWDWQGCNDGRDPVAAIAACTRFIDWWDCGGSLTASESDHRPNNPIAHDRRKMRCCTVKVGVAGSEQQSAIAPARPSSTSLSA